jgi:hypothetical protein
MTSALLDERDRSSKDSQEKNRSERNNFFSQVICSHKSIAVLFDDSTLQNEPEKLLKILRCPHTFLRFLTYSLVLMILRWQ